MSRRVIKYVFLALVFVGQVGYAADEWLEMLNQAGGKILLLNSKCSRSGAENGRLVISTTSAGPTLNGCWYTFADMIHIVWENGNTSSFSPNDFTYRKSK
jgi:hypothetical protein